MDSKSLCNICLRKGDNIKCNECTFLSCEECITEWYKTFGCKFKCPQCKQVKTFNIDFDKFDEEENEEYDDMPALIPGLGLLVPIYNEHVLVSNLSAFALNSAVINSMLSENQLFAPDQFVDNYNNWPSDIRSQWNYTADTMEIDDILEIISYRIHKIEVD